MPKSRHIVLLVVLFLGSVFLAGCDGYQGRAFERKPDGSIGTNIAGVSITFTSEDGTSTQTVTTDSNGYYKIDLVPQRYLVTATHPDYADYSSAPGFFVVTGNGYQTGNIFLKQKPVDLLMISSTLLNKDDDFTQAIDLYKSTLLATAGLTAEYIELDAAETLSTYGVKVNDPADWNEVRDVLQQVLQATQSSYIMILGGPLVVPRPVMDACCDASGAAVTTPSDAWYIDFDGDQIVDEGLSISRLPDLFQHSAAVIDALQTATALHNAGGFTLDNDITFSMYAYTTPPYGVCPECTEMEAFFNLLSTHDYMVFTGHGSPTILWSNAGALLFSVDYIDSVDLQAFHPVIIAYFPCSAGGLYTNTSSLAYELMKAGAGAYVARTTTEGPAAYVVSDFPDDIENGMRIGPALFQAMRKSALLMGETFKDNSAHIALYGDPTLRRQ